MIHKVSVSASDRSMLSLLAMALVFLACSIGQAGCGVGSSFESAAGLDFTPDPGLRVDNASNPHAGVGADGKIYLVYESRAGAGPGTTKMASSVDGIVFGAGSQTADAANDPRKVLMPDGVTWRFYEYNSAAGEMRSRSSTDGVSFTTDQGVRYVPHDSDHGTIGVYDIYSGLDNNVVMLYIGDMGGVNNVRMALSTDNGLTFTFQNGDVLGDKDAGGGGNTYVDPRSLLLPDGRRRLFTMTQGPGDAKPPINPAGIINSFISSDHRTYEIESGDRLKWSDFTEFSVLSLNDPVVIRLPEGGYRMYVAAMIEMPGGYKWAIVSASAQE